MTGGGQQPDSSDPFATGRDFLSVARDDETPELLNSRQQALQVAGAPRSVTANQSFYVAISKASLSQKWFLSTYIRQFFPGAVGGGAARSIGTRIVSFQVQNGKLFMFDASSIHQTSGTFDPQVLIEAYPLVTDSASFNRSPYAQNYVLIDPSAGLNRFSLLSDSYAGGSTPARFTIDISFLQRFRSISDGVTWEQIFTGMADVAVNDGTVDANALRASGTLGMSLRKYAEGPNFTTIDLPAQEFYFRSSPRIVPNSGSTIQTPAKWNVYPGMKPIVWKLAANLAQLKTDPYFSQYDIEGALKAGIENWNQVFGYEVLKAEMAGPDESAADDDKNFVLFDEDPSYGAAFANWRENPNTGEIRGASVYFSSLWLYAADQMFESDPGAPSLVGRRPSWAGQFAATRETPHMRVLDWNPMPQRSSCSLWAPQYRRSVLDGTVAADGGVVVGDGGVTVDADAGVTTDGGVVVPGALTKKQKVERYLTHVLIHEIGHTLGLRHNFKGSLAPPSSSVMEYIDDNDAIFTSTPQPYDVQAIKYLYGQSTTPPTIAFCTDDNTLTDPDCTRFDRGANPLVDTYGPAYVSVKRGFLMGTSGGAPNLTANNLLKYIRAGTPSQAAAAWSMAFDGITPPISPETLALSPVYGPRADFLAQRLLRRLWLDDAALRGDFKNDPPKTAPLNALALIELNGNLKNLDGVRTFGNRRGTVDILKKLQLSPAYQVLTESRDLISATLPTLSGEQALMSRDLVSRIDSAISPYFEN